MNERPVLHVVGALALATRALAADPPSPDVEGLRRDVAAARERLEVEQRRITELEARLAALNAGDAAPTPVTPSAPTEGDTALEAEFAAALGGAPASPEGGGEPGAAAADAARGGGTRLRLIDLSLTGLFAAGASTAGDDAIRNLNLGGHDPSRRGFTVQNLELSLLGAVDPWLKGEAHVVLQIDDEGETGVELEEAFVTTQRLPAGLQLKAGQVFTDFGRMNVQHPHAWAFASKPVILSRLLGPDGLRGPGARLSWLTPARWYCELSLGAQQASGETALSFLGTEEQAPVGGHPVKGGSVSALDDLLLSARWLNSVSLSGRTTLNLGASVATGPNGTGAEERTRLIGLDAYLKWQAAAHERGYPFVAWQAEWMQRRYEAGAFDDPDAGGPIPAQTLRDEGWYAQLTWGFRPGWTAAWRVERAHGDQSVALDARVDPWRDRRDRVSTALTWHVSEFSSLRFQYDWDRAQFLSDVVGASDEAHSAWIQWGFTLGAHGAHAF